jgi:3-deoxy-manno-octulosonate cytidylyltransferase (CMP-KDO synthetase)
MRSLIVIPARWGSTRFPGKPLAQVAGVSLIQRVYDRVNGSARAGPVYVATDDDRILGHVLDFGGKGVKTEGELATGTDRIAAALPIIESLEGERFEIIVNVQGDEPLMAAEIIDAAVAACAGTPDVVMSTVRRVIDDPADLDNPAVVKVVTDLAGRALYFTRARVPYPREPGAGTVCYKHIGLYVYRREFLLHLTGLAPTPLERAESLEQLRALEHGFPIVTVETTADAMGVDTPDDLERIRRVVAASSPR